MMYRMESLSRLFFIAGSMSLVAIRDESPLTRAVYGIDFVNKAVGVFLDEGFAPKHIDFEQICE